MKSILKKVLSIFLVFVMVFGMLSFLSDWLSLISKASAAQKICNIPDDFDLQKYNTQLLTGKANGVFNALIDYLESETGSAAYEVYKLFEDDKTFMTSMDLWEATKKVANPSNLISELNYQQEYESIIYSVLYDALCSDKLHEITYKNALTEKTKLVNKTIKTIGDATVFNKTDLSPEVSSSLKDTALTFICEGKNSKWQALGDYTKLVGDIASDIDTVFSMGTTVINAVERASMYKALMDCGADTIIFLQEMKNISSDFYVDLAIQAVIDSISQDWWGIVSKTITDVGFEWSKKAAKTVMASSWVACGQICPFISGMAIGEALGTTICNFLFATEDVIDQLQCLKMIIKIEDITHSTLRSVGNNTELTDKSSSILNFGLNFSKSLWYSSADAAVEMMKICGTKGVLNALFGGNSKKNALEFEVSMNDLKETINEMFSYVTDCWRYVIEKDYPEFFEIVEDDPLVKSVPVSSITFKDSTITCKVGDYPALGYTVAPANYTGNIGIKSSNENVLKSSDKMYFLPRMTEENIGTTELTFYSVDDPSICATATLTVVSKDTVVLPDEDRCLSGVCGDNATYILNKETGLLYISGTGAIYGNAFPNLINNNVLERSTIKDVCIEYGITTIGQSAFYYCDALENIMLPHSLTHIRSDAFRSCKSLINVEIPDSVEYIGDEAFRFCEKLYRISLGNGITHIGYGAFGNTGYFIREWKRTFGTEEAVYIGEYLLDFNNERLGSKLRVKEGTKLIAAGALSEVNSIPLTVIMPSVEYVCIGAFYNINMYFTGDLEEWLNIKMSYSNSFNSLYINDELVEDLVIPETVTQINDYAFSGCDSLKSVVLNENIESIGESAFKNCSNLEYIHIANGIESIDTCGDIGSPSYICGISDSGYAKRFAQQQSVGFNVCFGHGIEEHIHTYTENITVEPTCIDTGIKTMKCCCGDEYTEEAPPTGHDFNDWQVTQEATCTENGERAKVCKTCKETVITETIQATGHEVDDNWIIVSNQTVSENGEKVKKCTVCREVIEREIISAGKFNGTYGDDFTWSLDTTKGVLIISGVGEIINSGYYYYPWYDYTEYIESIEFSEGVTAIHGDLFEGYKNLTSITLPKTLITIGDSAFYNNKKLMDVKIPSGVTSIGAYAFRNCSSLTCIELPDTVKQIKDSAFEGCSSLSEVVLGNGIVSIGEEAFKNCLLNGDLTIPQSCESIGVYAFLNTNINTLYFNAPNCFIGLGHQIDPDSPQYDKENGDYIAINSAQAGFPNCKNVVFGNNVKTIPATILYGNKSLKYVYISDSVTKIGKFAFGDNYLYEIYYEGTEAEWNRIEIIEGNDIIYNMTIHFNSQNVEIPPENEDGYYTIVFDANGGEFFDGSSQKTYSLKEGEPVPYEECPFKEGHCFYGWDIYIPDVMPAANIIVKAIYEPMQYSAVFDANGGMWSDNITQKTFWIDYGSAITPPSETPIKEGFTFEGWADKYGDGSIVLDFGNIDWRGTEYVAVWKSINSEMYTITFIVNGVSFSEDSYATGEKIIEPIDPKCEGYTFAGWSPQVPDIMPAENLIVTATWAVNNYTVTWIVDDESSEVTHKFGTTISEPPEPIKEGYEFVGWTPVVPDVMPAYNLTFIAVFEKIVEPDDPIVTTYTVKWVVDGVETTLTYKECDTIVKPANPSKSGYTFKGWTPDVPSTMPAYDLTFTAVFEKNADPVVPSEPPKTDVINQPTQTTVSYGDAIILRVDASKIPAGGRVEWTANNGNFNYSANGDTCRIDPNKSGSTTFTATIYDAQGNAVSKDEQTMTSKAGFFDKIIAFFKKLFGLTKVIPQAFKGVL